MKAIKTPITYYGGKQRLLSALLPRIPEHAIYIEPFVGGGALFWAKPPSGVEVINDSNREVMNFYRVLQTNYDELYSLILESLHSRAQYEDAGIMYQHPHLFTEVQRAWAFWMQTKQSFASGIGKGWAYARADNSCEKKTANAKASFREAYRERLKHVQIECRDAVAAIKSRDCDTAFFYCDPPYPDTAQGHYKGYCWEDYRSLMNTLSKVKGKFLLSSYPNRLLDEYIAINNWKRSEISQSVLCNKNRKVKGVKKKIEVLVSNY